MFDRVVPGFMRSCRFALPGDCPTILISISAGDYERAVVYLAHRVPKRLFIFVVINDTQLRFHNREDPSRIFGRRFIWRRWVVSLALHHSTAIQAVSECDRAPALTVECVYR